MTLIDILAILLLRRIKVMNKIQFEILRLIKAGDKYESELFGSKLFKNPSTIINATDPNTWETEARC